MANYRNEILEIVESSHSHPTAAEVFCVLRQRHPRVAQATVYNNLNRLWEENRIRRISVKGMPDRYDRNIRHDHLLCKTCGKLLDLDLPDLTTFLQQQVAVPVLSYDLKLLCLCEQCRDKEQEHTLDKAAREEKGPGILHQRRKEESI